MNQESIKILLCGQDDQSASFLETALSEKSYTFQHYEDMEEAIQYLSPGDYHALILGLCQDPKVGRLDGLRAIPIFRKIDPNLPIIAISSDDSLETERQARIAGVFYYLLQPLDTDELKLSVLNAIRKYERLI